MEQEPDFAFGKKLGIHQILYGDIISINKLIGKLLVLMKEVNERDGVDCEFFRLDFRQPYFDETMQFPMGSLILDMKWGSKKQLLEKEKGVDVETTLCKPLPEPPKE